MPVRIELDRVLAERDMTAKALAQKIGISETQLSHFRSGKVRGIRFSTLAKLCFVLKCDPGELLGYDRSSADLRARRDEDR